MHRMANRIYGIQNMAYKYGRVRRQDHSETTAGDLPENLEDVVDGDEVHPDDRGPDDAASRSDGRSVVKTKAKAKAKGKPEDGTDAGVGEGEGGAGEAAPISDSSKTLPSINPDSLRWGDRVGDKWVAIVKTVKMESALEYTRTFYLPCVEVMAWDDLKAFCVVLVTTGKVLAGTYAGVAGAALGGRFFAPEFMSVLDNVSTRRRPATKHRPSLASSTSSASNYATPTGTSPFSTPPETTPFSTPPETTPKGTPKGTPTTSPRASINLHTALNAELTLLNSPPPARRFVRVWRSVPRWVRTFITNPWVDGFTIVAAIAIEVGADWAEKAIENAFTNMPDLTQMSIVTQKCFTDLFGRVAAIEASVRDGEAPDQKKRTYIRENWTKSITRSNEKYIDVLEIERVTENSSPGVRARVSRSGETDEADAEPFGHRVTLSKYMDAPAPSSADGTPTSTSAPPQKILVKSVFLPGALDGPSIRMAFNDRALANAFLGDLIQENFKVKNPNAPQRSPSTQMAEAQQQAESAADALGVAQAREVSARMRYAAASRAIAEGKSIGDFVRDSSEVLADLRQGITLAQNEVAQAATAASQANVALEAASQSVGPEDFWAGVPERIGPEVNDPGKIAEIRKTAFDWINRVENDLQAAQDRVNASNTAEIVYTALKASDLANLRRAEKAAADLNYPAEAFGSDDPATVAKGIAAYFYKGLADLFGASPVVYRFEDGMKAASLAYLIRPGAERIPLGYNFNMSAVENRILNVAPMTKAQWLARIMEKFYGALDAGLIAQQDGPQEAFVKGNFWQGKSRDDVLQYYQITPTIHNLRGKSPIELGAQFNALDSFRVAVLDSMGYFKDIDPAINSQTLYPWPTLESDDYSMWGIAQTYSNSCKPDRDRGGVCRDADREKRWKRVEPSEVDLSSLPVPVALEIVMPPATGGSDAAPSTRTKRSTFEAQEDSHARFWGSLHGLL